MRKPYAEFSEEQKEADRQRRRVANRTPEQLERERARRATENLTQEQRERRNERRSRWEAARRGVPLPPIPDGWTARRLTTVVDPDGETRQQSIRSVPEVAHREVVPDGHAIVGVSTLIGPGGVSQQWVKTREEDRGTDTLIERLRAVLLSDVEGRAEPIPQPAVDSDRLLAVFPIGDPHIGMLSWAAETGEDFDLRIASRNMRKGFGQLCSLVPAARKALILQLGDFFHSDSPANRTARSGNVLDVDGRWAKVLDVGIQLMVDSIDLSLHHFAEVEVENLIGNHDDQMSVVLSHVLAAYYRHEPRVIISKSPSPFRYHRHGRCIIGATHGDGAKPVDLGEIMAHDCAAWWDEGQHRRWYVGHVHHDRVHERRVCTVEAVRTIAGRDAWHHREGYRSDRDLKCDLWHTDHGLVNRHIVGIEQIRRAS